MTQRRWYKDEKPEVTVKRIQGILAANDIPTRLRQEIDNDGRLYSCGLHISDLSYHTNGKGVSRGYSMASAYAEMMERIQNQAVFQYAEFDPRLREEHGFSYDPAERLYLGRDIPPLPEDFHQSRLHTDSRNVYQLWEETRRRLEKVPVIFTPYHHLPTGDVVHLPRTFMLNVYGTNGMCAGNTREEALVQGFSEIMERHVMKKLYFAFMAPPTIPRSFIRKHAPEQYRIIEWLEKRDSLRIIVKDCSMGLGVPVVAVVLFFRDTNEYMVSIGSFPIWTIALERCLTEAFQGQRVNAYHNARLLRLSPEFGLSGDFENFMSLVIYGKGHYPTSLFSDTPDYDFDGFEEQSFRSQEDMLSRVIRTIGRLGHPVYLRDSSFLGFNSYQLIIPGLSEIKMISRNDWRELASPIPVLKYLCRMNELEGTELYELSDDMESFIKDHHYPNMTPFLAYVGLPISQHLPWERIPLEFILAFIYFKGGRIEGAFTYLDRFTSVMAADPDIRHGDLIHLFAATNYLSLMRQYSKDRSRIVRIMSGLYKPLHVKFASSLFREENSLLSMIQAFFPKFDLPKCYDCAVCSAKEACRYKELERIQSNILKAFRRNPIDQKGLSWIQALL